jgi:hypothetical protein
VSSAAARKAFGSGKGLPDLAIGRGSRPDYRLVRCEARPVRQYARRRLRASGVFREFNGANRSGIGPNTTRCQSSRCPENLACRAGLDPLALVKRFSGEDLMLARRLAPGVLMALLLSVAPTESAYAQDPHADHKMPEAQTKKEKAGVGAQRDHSAMTGHAEMKMNKAGEFLMSESSGTALQPFSWPMPMVMSRAGNWNLMWMGQAFIAGTQRSGPRGRDKLYSPNWGMLAAVHKLGRGSLMLRSMVSLDPATVTNRQYPLLFQTGESAYGKPIVDGQHPHELFMELSAIRSPCWRERNRQYQLRACRRSGARPDCISPPRVGNGIAAGDACASLAGLNSHRE